MYVCVYVSVNVCVCVMYVVTATTSHIKDHVRVYECMMYV